MRPPGVTCRPNVVRSTWATFPSGTPISVCNSTTSATMPGPSCAPAAPSASEVCSAWRPCRALTLRAAAHFDVEAAYDPHRGDFFLILRRHAGHFDRPAAVGTRRRRRRFQGLVNPFRPRAARLPAVLRTGPPAGTPAASLRPLLGERGGLSEPRPARGSQLTLKVLDLPLLTLVLASQAVDLALLAVVLPLVPCQLRTKPFDFSLQVAPVLVRIGRQPSRQGYATF